MEAWALLAVTVINAVLCVALSLLTCTLYAKRLLGRFKGMFKAEVEESDSVLRALRTERARAMANVRWDAVRSRQSAAPVAQAQPGAVQALAQAAVDAGGVEVEVPDWLVNMAKGAGVDVGKVLNGDPAEIAKAKAVMGGVKQELQQHREGGGELPGSFSI